jgi:hypothetical protein
MTYFQTLIGFILAFKPKTKLPEWFNGYQILNEKDLLNQKENVDKKLSDVNEIKELLAIDGMELQDSFARLLNLLNIKWKRIGTEDFLIEGQTNLVVEIYGTRHNLNSKKATQSLQHKEVLNGKINPPMKSCVIINHQRERRPNERDSLDHHAIKEYFEKHDICVISTLTLLKYYEKIINGELKTDDFLQKIISTTGELK